VDYYSLQKSVAAPAGTRVTDWTAELEDFADTAALIAQLDLVITVDTAVAHLAGALGKAVWVLLPFSADWRWMVDRQDSPWYPTMRLFRQPKAGDWQSPVAQMAAALRSWPMPDLP
jgi:ADP-heptose:LPS heptosyltransferase